MKNPLRTRSLISGGSGFLGSHLCERLLDEGHDILCLDNFFTGTRGNVLNLLDHPRFALMRHDVSFPLYVEVDEIYNLGCPASPVHYQFDPVQKNQHKRTRCYQHAWLSEAVEGQDLSSLYQ